MTTLIEEMPKVAENPMIKTNMTVPRVIGSSDVLYMETTAGRSKRLAMTVQIESPKIGIPCSAEVSVSIMKIMLAMIIVLTRILTTNILFSSSTIQAELG